MSKAETGTEEGEYIAIRRAVKGLHFGGWEEKEAAAAAIRDLANRDVSKKRTLAELGVVPSLVSMLVEAKEGGACQRLALEALVELADGSFTNKALIVESGLLTKLPQLESKASPSTKQSLLPLLLSISSLAKSHFPITSPPNPILSFLLHILRSPSNDTSIILTITALYNLSTQLDNTKPIISAGSAHLLLLNLCSLRSTKATQAALATLANLMLTEDGKRAVEEDSLVPEVLVDVMAREEGEPKCRELAGYVLAVVAGRSEERRRRMVELGVVEMLMEVGLIGRSRLVRERAIGMLRWFKEGGGGEDARRSRREIRCLVKQSLDRNMDSILRRGSIGREEEKKKKNCCR